jgi:hypothetical protein
LRNRFKERQIAGLKGTRDLHTGCVVHIYVLRRQSLLGYGVPDQQSKIFDMLARGSLAHQATSRSPRHHRPSS